MISKVILFVFGLFGVRYFYPPTSNTSPLPHRLFTPTTYRQFILGLILNIAANGLGSLSLGLTTPNNVPLIRSTRDLAISAALLWFAHEGKYREVGILMACCSIVWMTDVWVPIVEKDREWNGEIFGKALVRSIVGVGLLWSESAIEGDIARGVNNI